MKHDGIGHAEDRRVCANSDGQREHHYGGEARVAGEYSQRITDVVEHASSSFLKHFSRGSHRAEIETGNGLGELAGW